jgi:major membrane immunogen (membrane-anchored lipoprotein)
MKEIFRDPRTIAAITLSVATLSGCTSEHQSIDSFEDGQYTHGTYVAPKKSDKERLEISCKGSTLIVKEVFPTSLDKTKKTDNSHFCDDKRITESDNGGLGEVSLDNLIIDTAIYDFHAE